MQYKSYGWVQLSNYEETQKSSLMTTDFPFAIKACELSSPLTDILLGFCTMEPIFMERNVYQIDRRQQYFAFRHMRKYYCLNLMK